MENEQKIMENVHPWPLPQSQPLEMGQHKKLVLIYLFLNSNSDMSSIGRGLSFGWSSSTFLLFLF